MSSSKRGADDANLNEFIIANDDDDNDERKSKQQNNIVSLQSALPSAAFYQNLHKQLRSLDLTMHVQENWELPVWPHDNDLTYQVRGLFELAQKTLEGKDEGNYDATVEKIIANFSDYEKSMYNTVDEDLRKYLLSVGKSKLFYETLNVLTNKSECIMLKVDRVREQLANLARLSQAEIYPGTRTVIQRNKRREAVLEKAQHLFSSDEVANLPADAFAGDCTTPILTNKQPFDKNSYFSNDSIAAVKLPEEFKDVADVFNETIKECEVFLRSPSSTAEGPKKGHQVAKEEYERLVKHLLDHMTNKMKISKHGAGGQMQENIGLCFPGPRSQEKEGAQPLFGWILDHCTAALAPKNQEKEIEANQQDSSARHSPYKLSRSRKSPVVEVNGMERPIRYGDFAVVKLGCSLEVYPPDALPIIFELKPLFREAEKWDEIMQGGEQQAVCHMAKFVSMCFNFCGAGLNGRATCLVGSLAYLKVMRLELTGMGTENVKIQVRESDVFPLLNKENFKKWAESNDGHDYEHLTKRLYDTESQEGVPPAGFKLLYLVLTASASELFGQLWTGDESNGINLGKMIGFGSFSYVFAKEKGNTVTKISRMGRSHNLRTELAVLRHLDCKGAADEDRRRNRLPTFTQYGMHRVLVGAMECKLPCIEISPKGRTLASAGYLNLTKDDAEKIVCLALDVADALDFLHEKKVSHNDVSIQNILVTTEDQGLLVDFSVATTMEDEIIHGFVGNPLTAHSDAHFTKKWCAFDFHDFAALGFTLAILCAEQNPLWFGHVGLYSDSCHANRRREMAMQLISEFFSTVNDESIKGGVGERLARRCPEGAASMLKGWVQKDARSVFLTIPMCKSCKTGCQNGRCSCSKHDQKCWALCTCTGCKNKSFDGFSLDAARAEVNFDDCVLG